MTKWKIQLFIDLYMQICIYDTSSVSPVLGVSCCIDSVKIYTNIPSLLFISEPYHLTTDLSILPCFLLSDMARELWFEG